VTRALTAFDSFPLLEGPPERLIRLKRAEEGGLASPFFAKLPCSALFSSGLPSPIVSPLKMLRKRRFMSEYTLFSEGFVLRVELIHRFLSAFASLNQPVVAPLILYLDLCIILI
jgi:hypothetical protein